MMVRPIRKSAVAGFHGRNKRLRIVLPPILISILLLASAMILRTRSCDVESFETERALEHSRHLASAETAGRAVGTDGNHRTVEYLAGEMERIGLLPPPGARDYRQTFRTIAPQIDRNPVFTVGREQDGVREEFRMYSDYRILPSGRSRGIDFRGELVLAGHNLNRLGPEVLDGRIVLIESIEASEKKIVMAYDNGCEGILVAAAKDWSIGRRRADQSVKILDASEKSGADLMVGTIGIDAYQQLLGMVDTENLFQRDNPYAVIQDVRLKVGLDFPVAEAANLVGFIPGRDPSRTLILSAGLDGLGSAEQDGFFPGAANGAAGTGVLLEMARILMSEQNMPEKNIAFVFWNAGIQGTAGIESYLSQPAFPLMGTSLIHLDVLGTDDDIRITRIASEDGAGDVLKSKLVRFAGSIGLPAASSFGEGTDPVAPFIRAGIPSISISTTDPRPNNILDTPENLAEADLKAAAGILLQYVKRDIYGDIAVDYLTPGWRWTLVSILTLASASWFISAVYRADPNGSVFGMSTEALYYHPASEITRKTTAFLLTFGTTFFLIVLVVGLPRNGTVVRTDAELFTNQSAYLTLKETVETIGDFVSFDSSNRIRRQDLAEALVPAWLRTLALSAASMALALAGGGLSGITQSYGSRKLSPLRTAGSLAAASIPDVAVALTGIWLFLAVARLSPEISAALALKQFTVPVLVLALLPGAYVSRITSVTVQRELDREYVTLAAAKGLTRRQILVHELRPAILTGIVDTIPSLAAMMLTNLIVIEYLFAYRGIVNYLLLFHTRGDAGGFVIGALAAGSIYGLYALAGRLLALAVSPERRNRL